jgi:hypothetical protein
MKIILLAVGFLLIGLLLLVMHYALMLRNRIYLNGAPMNPAPLEDLFFENVVDRLISLEQDLSSQHNLKSLLSENDVHHSLLDMYKENKLNEWDPLVISWQETYNKYLEFLKEGHPDVFKRYDS